jgi:hypothetical protein
MSSERNLNLSELREDVAWRHRAFENVTRVSAIGAVVLLVLFVLLAWFNENIPVLPLTAFATVTGLVSLLCFFLNRRGRLDLAVILYMTSLTLTTFASVYYTGGVTGPLLFFFMIFPMLAGLLGNRITVRWVVVIVFFFWVGAAVMEWIGVVQVVDVPADILRPIRHITFVATFVLSGVLVSVFMERTQQALKLANQREQSLVESNRQAQALAQAEREARQREARTTLHIRETVARYVDYLSRITAGDYTARVDVGELDVEVEGVRELHALGEYLNVTVDALVSAITQAEEVQRRYTEQSWQTVLESGRVQPGFAYRQKQIIPESEWLPQMTQAVDKGASVAEDESAAVPLIINQQVIGAIGGQHPDGRPWSDEELSLIEAVTGQLAQTIESLRLFEDTQRRAARERVVGEVTARMRETLDIETVLKTAADEMRQALELPEVSVRLVQLDE